MSWLGDNWDKILSAAISAGVGGVIGFYSAFYSMSKDISELQKQVTLNSVELQKQIALTNAKLEQSIDPKIKNIDEFSNKMQNLEMRFIVIESQSTILRTNSEIMLRSQIGVK